MAAKGTRDSSAVLRLEGVQCQVGGSAHLFSIFQKMLSAELTEILILCF